MPFISPLPGLGGAGGGEVGQEDVKTWGRRRKVGEKMGLKRRGARHTYGVAVGGCE